LSLGACLLLEIRLNQNLKFCTYFFAQTISKKTLLMVNLEDLDYIIPTMVSLSMLPLALERGWSETTSLNIWGLPALIYKLSSLEETL
jgi:hypothetical protein